MNETSKSASLVDRLAQRIDLNAEASISAAPPIHISEIDADEIPSDPPPISDADLKNASIARINIQQPTAPESASSPIVALDIENLRDKGYLTPESPHSLLAEEYRIIKRPLLRMAFAGQRLADDREHVVLITSARPGEGKTFTAINLAMSVASEHDYHVLLIDGDVRERGLSQALGLADRRGLMDVLSTPSTKLSDVIVRTDVPHLSVLPAGRLVKFPTEFLASQRAQDVIGEMARRYTDRFIIIDSPPVLASSEPGVLAGYVGHVIMIALAGETPKQAITESLALIDACPNLSFILNKVTQLAGSGRFGYYGHYGEIQGA